MPSHQSTAGLFDHYCSSTPPNLNVFDESTPRHTWSTTEDNTQPAMSIDFPKEEERILARWKEIDAFLTQVKLV
jgi:hypothetical protein